MFSKVKKFLYFPIAYYFRFFAQIQLSLWKPKIIVITGSNGKTTLLHIIESQLGSKAKYSHHANSAYGIPFNILGLEREKLTIGEWPMLFLLAPLKAFKFPPKEKIYIVEADCDRPFEGKFLAQLLRPETTIWLSVSKTHTVNFPAPVEENVGKEFGNFLEYTKKSSIINGDSKLITDQLSRTKSEIKKITKKNHLQNYQLSKDGTSFKIDEKTYSIKYLLPEDTFYLLAAVITLLRKLDIPLDLKFNNFVLPPGRSTILAGIKKTTIIDSSYNATPASVAAILRMFKKYPGKKWAIIGDMIELGTEEEIEHEKLAEEIVQTGLAKVILVGPRVTKYTYPKLKSLTNVPIETFINPGETLDYLEKNIKGEEVLLFKGARFLEGIIEHLLKNKNDINKLCRREKAWQQRRKKWGL